MPAIFKTPYAKFGFAVFGLLVALVVLVGLLNLLSSSAGLQGSSSYSVPSVAYDRAEVSSDTAFAPSYEISESVANLSYPNPTPGGGNVSNLEQYETTSYYLSGRLRDFDTACDTLATLKAEQRYEFRSLSSALNSCRGTFYTDEQYLGEALGQLEAFAGVTTNRTTESVTRHREQIQTQNSILRQQLASVESTLREAEIAYDEIATFARAEQNVDAYSNAIDTKLRQIDQLTQRKINLTTRLDTNAQQAADLEARLGVVEVTAQFTRSYAYNPDQTARVWENAIETLRDTWTTFAIGITIYFGIFLLYTFQFALYALALLVLARIGWAASKRLWQQ